MNQLIGIKPPSEQDNGNMGQVWTVQEDGDYKLEGTEKIIKKELILSDLKNGYLQIAV